MDTSVLITVMIIWGIAVVTPGPNFFITAQNAVSRDGAFYTVLGIASGTVIWAVCGYMGISVLFQSAPWIYLTLKISGGLYLTYLGIKLILSGKNSGQKVTGKSSGRWISFRTGLFTNLSNPKTAAFVASLFAATLSADSSLVTGILSILLMFTISMAWYGFVACVFSLQKFRSGYSKFETAIKKTAGAVFIAFGLRLAADR